MFTKRKNLYKQFLQATMMEILKKHLEKLIKTLSLQDRKKLRTQLNDLIFAS